MGVTDTHSHIYLEAFDADRDDVVARAQSAGVHTILLPNVDASTIERLHHTEHQYACCKAMMGLHPTSVKENWRDELAIVQSWLFKRSYCAVGEIGIDLYWDKTFLIEQIDVFEQQIKWAIELDLPVVIHCREAFAEVFASLDRCYTPALRGVFHSFSGGVDELRKIEGYATFKAGINGVVTFKNSQLPSVISQFDPSLFVFETDAPYLAPTPYRGKRNEPAHVTNVADLIAELYGLSKTQLNEIIEANVQMVFGK